MRKPHLPTLQPRAIGSDAYARPWRMLLLSLVLGVVGGLAARMFLGMLALAQRGFLGVLAGVYPLTVVQATHLHAFPQVAHWNGWILLSTTLGGLIACVLVYTFAPEAEGHGTDSAVRSFHQLKGYIRARVIVVKSIASAITIGSGGAAGREGPTAQIAAGIGSLLGRLLKLSDDEKRLMVLIGMAAVFGAGARVPVATTIMVAEMTGGYKLMAPAMLAVAIAYLLQVALTRYTRYPSLYEAQLYVGSASPAHPDDVPLSMP
jgi:CIC family chloride channel protein